MRQAGCVRIGRDLNSQYLDHYLFLQCNACMSLSFLRNANYLVCHPDSELGFGFPIIRIATLACTLRRTPSASSSYSHRLLSYSVHQISLASMNCKSLLLDCLSTVASAIVLGHELLGFV